MTDEELKDLYIVELLTGPGGSPFKRSNAMSFAKAEEEANYHIEHGITAKIVPAHKYMKKERTKRKEEENTTGQGYRSKVE